MTSPPPSAPAAPEKGSRGALLSEAPPTFPVKHRLPCSPSRAPPRRRKIPDGPLLQQHTISDRPDQITKHAQAHGDWLRLLPTLNVDYRHGRSHAATKDCAGRGSLITHDPGPDREGQQYCGTIAVPANQDQYQLRLMRAATPTQLLTRCGPCFRARHRPASLSDGAELGTPYRAVANSRVDARTACRKLRSWMGVWLYRRTGLAVEPGFRHRTSTVRLLSRGSRGPSLGRWFDAWSWSAWRPCVRRGVLSARGEGVSRETVGRLMLVYSPTGLPSRGSDLRIPRCRAGDWVGAWSLVGLVAVVVSTAHQATPTGTTPLTVPKPRLLRCRLGAGLIGGSCARGGGSSVHRRRCFT